MMPQSGRAKPRRSDGQSVASQDASDPADPDRPLVDAAVQRALASRRVSYTEDVNRILAGTYRAIKRTGSLDPTLRDILEETGISTQAFYRHFRTKDELFLVLMDDGRRLLAGYLEHQMAKETSTTGEISAWIAGVLAQARDPDAADRTRPFMANLDRIAEQYPDEQQRSVDVLLDLLVDAITRSRNLREPTVEERFDAQAIYHLAIEAMHEHIRYRTAPTEVEIDRMVAFCLAGLCRSSATMGRSRVT
jgi:AcrR family transcriptional regulator